MKERVKAYERFGDGGALVADVVEERLYSVQLQKTAGDERRCGRAADEQAECELCRRKYERHLNEQRIAYTHRT